MGSLGVGDLIIVTDVLYFPQLNTNTAKAKSLFNSVHTITQVDCTGCPYPYKIEVGHSTFWVEGIRYSSLILELM